MKKIYFDESGISDNEPILFVGGIIIDSEIHAEPLIQRCHALQKKYYRPEMLEKGNIPFHAKDIFHGKKDFDTSLFPDPGERFQLIREICEIPRDLGVSIIHSDIDKHLLNLHYPLEEVPKYKRNRCRFENALHFASLDAVSDAELYMQTHAAEDEAQIYFEDNDDVRRLNRAIYAIFQGRPITLEGPHYCYTFAFERIVKEPIFIKKGEDYGTQIADAVLYALNRLKLGKDHGQYFYEPLRGLRFARQMPPPPPWANEPPAPNKIRNAIRRKGIKALY